MKNSKLLVLTVITTTTINMFNLHQYEVYAASNITPYMTITSNHNFESEITSFSDLGILSKALNIFLTENPQSTEQEQDLFLIKYVESGNFANEKNKRGLGDYIPGYGSLNSVERDLALKHPSQAITVYNCANDAVSATLEYYGESGYQNNSDAFRHCCWNALMKKEMGATNANTWATAHESDSSGIDKEMDLYNNYMGRIIDVSGKSNSQIYELVKKKVKNGYCKRIINNKLTATNGSGLIK